MARPKKQIVDYFPHSCNHGKTMFILQNKYGNDGYAFWFKTLELLGQSEGHFYDCNNPSAWEFLLAKTLVSEELALKILQTLADLEAIDAAAWALKIIWSHNFVENLKDVYVRRKCEKPEFPASLLDYYRQKTPLSGTETPLNEISVNINPQSKVKEIKVKEIKVKEIKVKESKVEDVSVFLEIISDLNKKTGKSYKTTDATKALIKARLSEGFTLEDFQKVHENMSAKWKDDPKMNQYLRPATLYQASKFESYLNSVVSLSDRGIVSELTEKNLKVLENYKFGGENAK
ncbi:MAG: hypothetical protein DDT22_01222 [candidate division WS2 bacterium]|nr:hypothetical protein [Candidatus Lithacetigena glycinireducens]